MLAWRPDWLALTLIYWCMATPQRVGVGAGWFSGLLLDAIQFDLLGKNALAMAVVAYLVSQFHLRVRMFPVLQQSLVVLVVICIDIVLVAWIHSIVYQVSIEFGYWKQALMSMLCWPFVYLVLRYLRRRSRIG